MLRIMGSRIVPERVYSSRKVFSCTSRKTLKILIGIRRKLNEVWHIYKSQTEFFFDSVPGDRSFSLSAGLCINRVAHINGIFNNLKNGCGHGVEFFTPHVYRGCRYDTRIPSNFCRGADKHRTHVVSRPLVPFCLQFDLQVIRQDFSFCVVFNVLKMSQ